MLTDKGPQSLGSQALSHSFLTLGPARVMSFPGAILTIALRVPYLQHEDDAAMWGLSTTDDQRNPVDPRISAYGGRGGLDAAAKLAAGLIALPRC